MVKLLVRLYSDAIMLWKLYSFLLVAAVNTRSFKAWQGTEVLGFKPTTPWLQVMSI